MNKAKYLGYIALICAVLLDLYAGNPNRDPTLLLALEWFALGLALLGLGGLMASPLRMLRR